MVASQSIGPLGQSCTCRRKLLKRSISRLATLLLIVDIVNAQAPPSASSAPLVSPVTPTTLSSRPSTSSASRTTSSPATTTFNPPILNDPTGIFTPTSTPLLTEPARTVSEYYYLIILAVAVVLAVVLWLFALRRRKRKLASRTTRHSALARDINGYSAQNRRWHHGPWRLAMEQRARQEEGLDERGEAPPPYKPDGQRPETSNTATDEQSVEGGEASRRTDRLSIPLRAYQPGVTSPGQKPPKYGDIVQPEVETHALEEEFNTAPTRLPSNNHPSSAHQRHSDTE